MPDRLTVAAARLDGVLPLAPAWLAERFPDLWATVEAARHEVKRSGLMGQTPNKILYLGNGPLTPATFRLKGQRGPHPSRALIVEGHSAPEAALAALVGPLVMFRWTEEAEPEREEDPARAVFAPSRATCARCSDPPQPGGELCSVCSWMIGGPVFSPPRPRPPPGGWFPADGSHEAVLRRAGRPRGEPPAWTDSAAWSSLIRQAAGRDEKAKALSAWAKAAGGEVEPAGPTLLVARRVQQCTARSELITAARTLGWAILEPRTLF